METRTATSPACSTRARAIIARVRTPLRQKPSIQRDVIASSISLPSVKTCSICNYTTATTIVGISAQHCDRKVHARINAHSTSNNRIRYGVTDAFRHDVYVCTLFTSKCACVCLCVWMSRTVWHLNVPKPTLGKTQMRSIRKRIHVLSNAQRIIIMIIRNRLNNSRGSRRWVTSPMTKCVGGGTNRHRHTHAHSHTIG